MICSLHNIKGHRRVLAAVALATLVSAASVLAYWTAHGSGTARGSVGTLPVPTISKATPGTGTVALTWTTVTPLGSGEVTYYVSRDGGTPAGNCPTATKPEAGVTSCTDSGLSAGSHKYTVTAVWRSWTATSAITELTLASGVATKVVLSGSTANLASGTTRTFTATIEDAAGNTVKSGPDSTDTITFSKTAGAGSVSGLTVLAASEGVATDTVTGSLAGSVALKAAGTINGKATNSNELTFEVTFGTPSKLVYTTPPSGASGETAFTTQPVITAKDAAGNTVTTYAGTVTLSIKSGTGTTGATLSGCSGSLSNGVTTFSGCKIDKAGSGYVLSASDGALSVDSTSFTVAVGSATKLVLGASLTTLTAGGSSNLTITAVDAGGNTVATYSGSHSLTFSGASTAPAGNQPTVTNSSGTAIGFGSSTAISFTSGVATVSSGANGAMTLYKAETANVIVTDGSIGNATSPLPVTVNAGPGLKLAWTNISTISPGIPNPNPCFFTCTYSSGFGNNNTWEANVSITDGVGNTVSGVGTAHNVTVTLGGTGNGSITGGSPATLTMPASGPAQSTKQVQFKGGNKTTWSNTLTATSAGFASATASFSK